MTSLIQSKKEKLRSTTTKKLEKLSTKLIADLGKEIARNIAMVLLSYGIGGKQNILTFKSIKFEPNIEEVFKFFKSSKSNIYLADFKTLTFSSMDVEVSKSDDFSIFDIIIIPGLLFSKDGYRLGRGGGWYDRVIPKLRKDAKKIGVCFESQIVKSLPIEPHDQKIDVVVTEDNIYD